MSHTTAIILMLIGVNLSLLGVLLRLRRIDKAIDHMPYIIGVNHALKPAQNAMLNSFDGN